MSLLAISVHKLLRCEIPCDVLQSDLDNGVAHVMACLCLFKKSGWLIISADLVLLVNEALGEGCLADSHLAKDLNRDPLGRLI